MGSNHPYKIGLVQCSSLLMLLILLVSIIRTTANFPSLDEDDSHAEDTTATTTVNDRDKDIVYIVYLGHHKNRYKDIIINQHLKLLSLVKGSLVEATESIIYHYKHSFSGFAAMLTSDEADQLSRMEEVVSVFPSEQLKLQTTRSWEFLGLVNPITNRNTTTYSSELWDLAKEGKDVIIGVVDSGIWPESKSFNDEGMEELPPGLWRGECVEAEDQIQCNKKIIGARWFKDGFEKKYGPLRSNFKSARDGNGHGTHVAATAAGRVVPNVSSYPNGPITHETAMGGFPLARLAIYKVCWFKQRLHHCDSADTLAAIDAAIADGVHLLSISLSSDRNDAPLHVEAISLGSLHAIQAGVLVSTAVGNTPSGPAFYSASNLAPWVISAAAATIDRRFVAQLQLGSGPDAVIVEGESVTPFTGIELKQYPLLRGNEALRPFMNRTIYKLALARECQIPGTLDPAKVENVTVICLAGPGTDQYLQSVEVKRAGGVAMISAKNDSSPLLDLKVTQVPTISVAHDATVVIKRHYATSMSRVAEFFPITTTLGAKPAPVVAEFSSQGPNLLVPSVLKPDVSAPGVQILSAWSEAIGPSSQIGDNRVTKYNIMSGSSVACPHVTAIAALLKSIHPSWSPSAIKSAIMTTASDVDNMGEPIKGYERNSSNDIVLEEVTPFSVGAGQINPRRAVDPGLIYDATPDDYHEFICNIGYKETTLKKMADSNLTKCPETLREPNALNQPYVVVDLSTAKRKSVVRRVTNVGPSMSVYHAVLSPSNFTSVEINIEPLRLQFAEVGQTHTFRVHVSLTQTAPQNFHFRTLTWKEDQGDHRVKIPIIVST